MNILQQIESYEGLKLKDVVFNKGVRKLTATFLYNPSILWWRIRWKKLKVC
ncbi:MAG: hypothetical protein IJA72_03810 [Clostridia bacterium]|nr:hypothetical protein [Clostridia bacterium]